METVYYKTNSVQDF